MTIRHDNKPGTITGYGPNFAQAMAKFRRRQERNKQVGTWRHHGNGKPKGGHGRTDCDWAILDEQSS